MTTVIFEGDVTDQSQAGEIVTITVTKPDTTTETLIATTLADKTYSTTKDYTVAGNYSAKAHGDEDAGFLAWDSGEEPFTLPKQPRSGTLTVRLA